MRGITAIVKDGLEGRGQPLGLVAEFPRVRVPVPAGEIAAGNFHPDPVPFFEYLAGRKQVDGIFNHRLGFD